MVVQLGLAMMPLGSTASACGFTSATTSGTSGSERQAEELSITIAPAAAALGASSFEVEPPAENSTTSRPAKSAVAASSTTTPSSSLPAERAEANRRRLATGKLRSARISRIIEPTRPVAPTTPTLSF